MIFCVGARSSSREVPFGCQAMLTRPSASSGVTFPKPQPPPSRSLPPLFPPDLSGANAPPPSASFDCWSLPPPPSFRRLPHGSRLIYRARTRRLTRSTTGHQLRPSLPRFDANSVSVFREHPTPPSSSSRLCGRFTFVLPSISSTAPV